MAHDIILDFNLAMSHAIGDESGLHDRDLTSFELLMTKCHHEIWNRQGKGSDFLGFLDLPMQDEATIQRICDEADRLAAISDTHVVLGIGGSYLGAKALFDALCPAFHNLSSRDRRSGRPRLFFEGNNLDAVSMQQLLDFLPSDRPHRVEDAFSVNVISKSGTTLETAAAFRIFQQRAKAVYGNDHATYITATTDAAKGKLKPLADLEGYRTFVIPDDVGGRYSVFTPVGLLPAAVAGIDIRALLGGARRMAERCQNPDLRKNPAYTYAVLQQAYAQKGYAVSYLAIWNKALESIGFWYDQLAAESLGKQGKGRVPVTMVNTRDLHARGQQLQEGPRHALVTNLLVGKPARDLVFPHDSDDQDGLNYVAGKSIHEMLGCAIDGTNFAYASDRRPTVNLVLPELNADTLGQLLYLLEVATVAEGYLMGINPLDQPGVEAYKKFMFALLGRSDMAAAKAEFDQRPRTDSTYIV